MDIALVVLILGVTFNIFVGLLVSLKSHDKAARSLGLVAMGLIVWEVANYFADGGVAFGDALFWNRLTFVGPLLVMIPSYYFVYFLRGETIGKLRQAFLLSGTAAIGILCFTVLIVEGISPRFLNGEIVGYNPEYGALYGIYIVWLLSLVVLHAINIFKPSGGRDDRYEAQMHIIRIGSLIAIAIPFFTNLVLPNIYNSSVSSKYVPLMSIVYMGSLSIAILKHKLLDIRGFVLRAGAYSLTTLLLSILYVAPTIFLLTIVLSLDFELVDFIIAVIIGTIIATNYHRLMVWFNNVTKQIFFRESYDPASMMADLNKSLVGVIDVGKISNITAKIVHENFKPEFTYFILNHKLQNTLINSRGSRSPAVDQNMIQELSLVLDKFIRKNITTINSKKKQSAELNKLADLDIGLVIKLMPSGTKDAEHIGFIVLGVRKSGKPYDINDQQVLETISNTVIIAIQNAINFEEIQKFNTTLQGRVDEATRKYRVTNEKLKKLDETKDEFISMASHQLRTPLTSVKGYLSMVLEGDVGELNKQQEELLKQSFLSSQRMVNLIADLLNLSRLNTGKFVIDASPIDLRDVVDGELMQLHETAKAKDIELTYEKPATFPTLFIDENKIHQVVMNFVDNAIYYTPAGGSITVALNETPTAVEYTVTDTGIGVPREVQRHLFTKFYRADNAKRARPDGTGLGLFMAKKVIIAQGGSVIFESEEGKGSTFGFRFNKSRLAIPDQAVKTAP